MSDTFDELKRLLARVADLDAAAAVLEWDQETYMPGGAATARAHQIATLRTVSHEYFTSDDVGTLLDKLEPETADLDPASTGASLIRVTRRDFERARKLPASLVTEMATAVSHAKNAWREARETNTYATFAPHLARLIDLNVRKAEALGYAEQRYDALLDEYEPGMTTATIESVFGDLREQLVPIVQAIAMHPAPEDGFLYASYDTQKQWDFGMAVLRDLGYDFDRGRQDLSAHPFTTSFSINDVRLTTRVAENFFPTSLFGTIHEAGHGLYEQGIDPSLDRTPLADGTSLGMHESQSRLWENMVGRSRPFWQHYYPKLQQLFPAPLADVSLDAFYRGINKVVPSLIRVEADEVTYNLHIMLRFELEKDMIEGRVSVKDLPDLWNTRMEQYLGLRPDTNADGVLQDIHWSLGAMGYFPTYALGNLMSAQLFNQAKHDLPGLNDEIAHGQFERLLHWLRTHIHQHGRKIEALDLLKQVTDEELSAEPWLAYIREKYSGIYGSL